MEFAQIALSPRSLTAHGVAIGSEPVPYRLDYELETGEDFVTTRLEVTAAGEGWSRSLDLRRDPAGMWSLRSGQTGEVDLPAAGGEPTSFSAALDCDLGLSPVTNLMPVLHHRHEGGGPREFTMAWVSVPDLSVRPDGQRYRYLRSDADLRLIRYEAVDGGFAADLTFDEDGGVVEYPGIARRVPPR